jgi:lipopolysaccharide transport system permease protein
MIRPADVTTLDVLAPMPQHARDLTAPIEDGGSNAVARGAEWIREIVDHRDLFFFLVWRDVKIRYKQTFLGALWALIQPLASMVILTVFFGRIAGVKTGSVPYGIFSYSALVPWTFFSTSVSAAALSMTTNSNLLTKIYFPRIVIPATPVFAGVVDFAIASSFLLVLVPVYGLSLRPQLFLWPLLAVPLCILCLGLGMIFACMNARYRDMKYALPFAVQMLLFATPIIYPLESIPARFQWLAALNPLTGFVEAFRACVLPDSPFHLTLLWISLAETAVIFALGLWYLRRTERVIADYV